MGAVDTENDYVPGAVNCENGRASWEALKAQAVAARKFAYYKMNLQGFVQDGSQDQVYSYNFGSLELHRAAALATSGGNLFVEDAGVNDILIAAF